MTRFCLARKAHRDPRDPGEPGMPVASGNLGMPVAPGNLGMPETLGIRRRRRDPAAAGDPSASPGSAGAVGSPATPATRQPLTTPAGPLRGRRGTPEQHLAPRGLRRRFNGGVQQKLRRGLR